MTKNSIVLVPFPFDGLSTSKVRPALCLTSEIGKYKHVIIAFISSKIPDELLESDYLIISKAKKSSRSKMNFICSYFIFHIFRGKAFG
ncbi:MAG: type II toxin-antitoxin system PemK/MazF family toxin [Chlorobi bacterium]|nr:type II toxin-antitoxin system PemK/MazF family toxin [Chlorobiota bacterium]